MIILDNVTWFYSHLSLLFNLHIKTGEKVAVLGPSGSGKSTLLNLIAGFIVPNSGLIWLNGKIHNKKTPAQRPVSILFQENNLFAHLTVGENIGLGLHPGLKLTTIQRAQLKDIAKQVGLEMLLDSLPMTISGGERQRAALARCLLRQQPILLLDEPFSSLDQVLRINMIKLLNKICTTQKLTLLIVSHNLDDALRLAPRTLLIVDGHICYDGSTKLLVNDTNALQQIY